MKKIPDFKLLKWANHQSISKRVLQTIDIIKKNKLKPKVLIDLGCGTGQFLEACEKLKIKTLIGVDKNPEALRRAWKRLKRSILINSSIEKISVSKTISPHVTVSIIGVLQNCGSDPLKLLNLILTSLRPAYLILETKTSKKTKKTNRFNTLNVNELKKTLLYVRYRCKYMSHEKSFHKNIQNSIFLFRKKSE